MRHLFSLDFIWNTAAQHSNVWIFPAFSFLPSLLLVLWFRICRHHQQEWLNYYQAVWSIYGHSFRATLNVSPSLLIRWCRSLISCWAFLRLRMEFVIYHLSSLQLLRVLMVAFEFDLSDKFARFSECSSYATRPFKQFKAVGRLLNWIHSVIMSYWIEIRLIEWNRIKLKLKRSRWLYLIWSTLCVYSERASFVCLFLVFLSMRLLVGLRDFTRLSW